MKNMLKKALSVLLTVILVLSLTSFMASAASAPTISIDGTAISIPAGYGTPYIDDAGRTQVPIRAVTEALGATISWDGDTSSAVINGTIRVPLGSSSIVTPYGDIAMDTTSVAADGRIYVPVRFLCQALGYDVTATGSAASLSVNILTKVELNVSAAASLTDAMKSVATLYNAKKPGSKLTFNFGASGTLQKQIEQGAPADLFFSASTSNMDKLKSQGLLVDSTIKNLLGNDLVLVVPKSSTLQISSFADVAGSAVSMIALGDPKSVPAGQYAQDVFTYYSVWDQVKTKATYDADVRAVLSHVASGNVDCGVVYRTDALTEPNVKIVCTAIDASHKAIVYPGAVVKASALPYSAADFMNFMSTSEARAVFANYGFKVL